jgi:cytoskeletal protein CcmA (bactofilin family)
MAKPVETTESNKINLIGAGTSIKGEINSTNGDIRIDGNLNGNLTTNGKLVVGPTGIIVGDISCKNADVFGKIEGRVSVSELLSLKANSNLKGEIITSKLSIEPGAIFTGTCDMGDKIVGRGDARPKGEPAK